jgi:hypothetical protein
MKSYLQPMKRRSILNKTSGEFDDYNTQTSNKPRLRIVINPNGTLTEVDDSIRKMSPTTKKSIKMPKHAYADMAKFILDDCIKQYKDDPIFKDFSYQ